MTFVPTGIYYALGLSAAGFVVGWLAGPMFALPLWLLALFCLWFFRDPERLIPAGLDAVAPADGKVMAVKRESPERTRISIFLNVFDVHVNRTPVGGVIREARYRRGLFLVASRERCSEENEQMVVTVEMDDGVRVTYKQIAGLIARRIVFTKKPGDRVEKGERIGLMKFGSRMDVLLGPEWDVLVRPGMRVEAGTTIIAKRRMAEPVLAGMAEEFALGS